MRNNFINTVALAASAMLMASAATAEPINISCEPEKYLIVGGDGALIKRDLVSKSLYDYICFLAVNSSAVLRTYPKEPEKKSEVSLADVAVVTSNVMVSTEGIEDNAVMQSSSTGRLTLFSVTSAPRCTDERWELNVGNYKQQWCNTSGSSAGRATMNLYYVYPGFTTYLSSYFYHCNHRDDRDQMPTEVKEAVCP